MHERTVDYCRNRMEWSVSEAEYNHWKSELDAAQEADDFMRQIERDIEATW